MERADLQLLWEYSIWANGQILAAACRLPPAALREPLACGEAAATLTALGASPGELDFTAFLSSRQTGEE